MPETLSGRSAASGRSSSSSGRAAATDADGPRQSRRTGGSDGSGLRSAATVLGGGFASSNGALATVGAGDGGSPDGAAEALESAESPAGCPFGDDSAIAAGLAERRPVVRPWVARPPRDRMPRAPVASPLDSASVPSAGAGVPSDGDPAAGFRPRRLPGAG